MGNRNFGNTSRKDSVEYRREVIAALRLRGASMRAIAQKLYEEGIVNPKSGAPYSAKTIKYDLDAIRDEWKRSASESIEAHISRQLAEIEEIKRAAWAQKRIDLVLKALEREMQLLGTSQQVSRVQVDDWRSQAIEEIKAGKLDFEALARHFDEQLATELFRAAGVPVSAE